MTEAYEERLHVDERIRALRKRGAELRDVLARMQRAEAAANLALSRARAAWAEFKNRSIEAG
jgi:hypothetical protein